MIAIAAPSYDAADTSGMYFRFDPRTSFRSRLEGWNIICSAVKCTGPRDTRQSVDADHMHNNVHDWVGGQMDDVPAAVNDPVFNLHHCNVDRILESWMQRFAGGQLSSSNLLPAYVPVSGGHPGHNRDDYMVPFFPLITAGEQYRVAEEWGYVYDELILADIPDDEILDCSNILPSTSCPICDANTTCINCTISQAQMCPAPNTIPERFGIQADTGNQNVLLGLGLGLGILLFLCVITIIILVICIIYLHKSSHSSRKSEGLEMTVKS